MVRGPVVRGPVVRGPVVRGPVVRGPVVSGPVVRGPVVRGSVVMRPAVSRPVVIRPVVWGSVDLGPSNQMFLLLSNQHSTVVTEILTTLSHDSTLTQFIKKLEISIVKLKYSLQVEKINKISFASATGHL